MPGPDFIGVGAQRAGTSWLHAALEGHPSIWLPPLKELHYFDDPLSENRNRYYRFLRMRLVAGLWVRRPLSVWDLHYFLARRNDDWYAQLFDKGHRKGKRTGEITPSYATLETESFVRMRAVNPEVKIIFVMRDPILRSWSSIIKSREKHGLVAIPTTEEALSHSRRDGVVSKSSYVDTVQRLDRVFKPDRIFYGFFEDMLREPVDFLAKILRFLEVDVACAERLAPRQPVGAAAGGRRPHVAFERALAADFLPDIERLCARFKGAPHDWRARYAALLNEHPSIPVQA
jgi:hypothetical protein